MGFLTAYEGELPEPVTATLPRAFGDPADPMMRFALTPAEVRALMVGSRLLGRPLPMVLAMASQIRSDRVSRWARPYSDPRGMLTVRVHVPTIELAESQVEAARFGLRPETYLVARAFELLRERAEAEPVRWAFVGLPTAQMPGWKAAGETSLHLG